MNFSASDDGGDEDQEDSSSSSLHEVDALKSFREQWQRELQVSPKHTDQTKKNQFKASATEKENIEERKNEKLEDNSAEVKAKNLFLQGIENEKSGKLYEAIQFYRRAVQLVPDIEFRLYESTKLKPSEKVDFQEKENFENTIHKDNVVETNDLDEQSNDCDILGRLSRIIQRNGYVCSPLNEQSTTHISALPTEIILYILRWVVSSELDIRSLETVSRVCRGFFVCARDAEIWKTACIRVWGVNCGKYEPNYSSWREMYMKRPRLRYNGCYISKTTYIRPGENSFQDLCYKPWHLVEYYRYLRFFPEGKVLMLTSTEDAQSCVTSLKNRDPRNPAVLVGHYRLRDSCVSLVLKRQEVKNPMSSNFSNRRRKRNEPVHDSGEQTFHVEFEIQTYRKRPNSQLSWLCYSIYTKYRNGEEVPTKLSLGGRYPQFRFSRVKSYTQESEFPLQ